MTLKGNFHKAMCHICSSFSEQIVVWGPYVFSGQEYRVTECIECKSLATTPLPSDEVLKKLYSESFAYQWYKDHYYFKFKDSLQRINEYKQYLGSSVLDYGGGMGYFSQACNENGMIAKTYDPFANKSNINDLERWDTIVALHMLEHSNDLHKTLTDIKNRLNAGGKLILAVPNALGDGYKRMGERWVWAQPPLIHIFHFSSTGLSELLNQHGFKVVSIKYKDRWDANTVSDVFLPFLFRIIDRLWRKNQPAILRSFFAYTAGSLRLISNKLYKQNIEDSKLAEIEIIATLNTSLS